MDTLLQSIADHWIVWFVSVVLIVAAVIDGMILKVPNWLNLPFIISGWCYWCYADGVGGLGWSFLGTIIGAMPLLLLRNVGGMGAGDVKLAAGTGAWLGSLISLKLFVAGALAGGLIAAVMILRSGKAFKHYAMAMQILEEWKTVRRPSKLAAIARERKPTMTLLPYGIPMAIGSVIYFAFAGMLI
ncbi:MULTISPECIES: prepilin peptidase [Crateriforma]|uniref:Type IV leader peptidase family protein n=1 Tax=Crateriforma conspicua TaxID=2527996 RepID=A0A5C6FLE7_9PLAN|nr:MULTISPECIES: A24 family peptidase [Crateriforma]QDV61767.1 Type IV leader peptidase family protein [Crateriforma conspicua]TWT71982.1 Type IV leader peptidase family protein [Crateriforma conspicua]TWU62857.1 Type IV leader peptidase family protein [Crateriforma conspicua]